MSTLPAWAAKLVSLYESHAASQFILYGNVSDQFVLPLEHPALQIRTGPFNVGKTASRR